MSDRLLIEFVGLVGEHQAEHAFLSNVHPAAVEVDVGWGLHRYASTEHAYQAAKAVSQADHDHVAAAPDPREASRRGRAVPRRDDWREVRVERMRQVLAAKFSPGSPLAARLLATGEAVICEVAPHGDRHNGVGPDADGTWSGKNVLGVLLMERRGQLRAAAPTR